MTKQALRDRTHTITHDLVVGHTYEVAVVAVGMDGTKQAIESAPKNAITIVGKESEPNPVSTLTATGFLNSISLVWNNPLNYDYKHTEIWRSATNNIETAVKIAEVKGITYIDSIGVPSTTRNYWVRAVNTSGKSSTYYPDTVAGVAATSLGVAATDIDDFSITATKMFTNTIILSGDSWTNNSPGVGSVAWNTHTVVYNGESYPIVAGSTSSAYIYWTIGDTLYTGSATHPVLGNDAFMVAINTSGTHTLVWNSSANMVIGTAFIADLAVTNAKVNDLSASKLTAGTIDASVITVTNLNATNISTGTLTGRKVQTAGTGGRIVLDPTSGVGFEMYDASNNPRFYIRSGGANDGDVYMGNGTQGFLFDNSAGTCKFNGVIAVKAGSSGIANLSDAGDLAVKDKIGANDCDTTIISGGLIITDLLSANNITTGILTGLKVRTDTGAVDHYKRIELDVSDNTFRMYDASNVNIITIDDDASGYIKLVNGSYSTSIYVGGINLIGYGDIGVLIGQQVKTGIKPVLQLYGYETMGAQELVATINTDGSMSLGGGATACGKLYTKGYVNTLSGYQKGGVTVVGAQQGAIADSTAVSGTATSGGYGFVSAAEMNTAIANTNTIKTQLNLLLAACRTHGLIAT